MATTTLTSLDPSGGDDTAAIQAELSAASVRTSAGGIVRLSEGDFSVTGLTVPTRVTLQGEGRKTRLVLAASSNTHVIRSETSAVEHVIVRDLSIDGNRSNQGAGDFDGIHMHITDATGDFSATSYTGVDPHHSYENLFIYNCKRHGIYYSGRGATNFSVIEIQRTSGHAFFLEASDCHLYGINVGGVSRTGFWDAGGGNSYVGCKAFFTGQDPGNTDGDGYYTGWGVNRNTYVGCEAQDTWRNGWLIRGEGHVLAGCQVDAIGSLYPNHGLGSSLSANRAAIRFENAQENMVMGFTMMDRFKVTGTSGAPYGDYFVIFDHSCNNNEVYGHVWDGHIKSSAVYYASTTVARSNRAVINGTVKDGGYLAPPERHGQLSSLTGSVLTPDFGMRNHGTLVVDTAGKIEAPVSGQKGYYTLTAYNSAAMSAPQTMLSAYTYKVGSYDKDSGGLNIIQLIATEKPSDNSRMLVAISTPLTSANLHEF